jgi:hypothetical protein
MKHYTSLSNGWSRILEDNWPSGLWVVLRYTKSNTPTEAYAYEIFANIEEPTYLNISAIQLISGPLVMAAQVASPSNSTHRVSSYTLCAYHVGQGMCALIKGQNDGFLLDVGAGTPVNRADYRRGKKSNGTPFLNELKSATSGLALQAVISHPDSDHWRLLDWDPGLLTSVTAIFHPSGTAALAFKSPHVIGRVHSLGTTTVYDRYGAKLLTAYRSLPATSDRNGECLVVETYCHGVGLFPGDYVYNRMATDGDPVIQALSTKAFDAVMVPHHGDTPSSSVTITPASAHSTPAFFSAGTHSSYKHPKKASLTAHTKRLFKNINNHKLDDIIECKLLP